MTTAPNRYTLSEALLRLGEDELRRKGNQDGSVFARGNRWHVSYREFVADAEGNAVWKTRTRSLADRTGPERKTRKEAERLAFELYVSKANGLTITPGGVASVAEFVATRYQPDHVEHLAKGTRSTYESILRRHILPSIGHCQLRDVSRTMVQMLIAGKLKAGLSTQTITHVRNITSSLFRHARRLNYITGELPTEDLILPQIVHNKRNALTPEQVEAVKLHCDERTRLLIDVLCATGMRIGEAAGLRWSCVNLEDTVRYVGGIAIPPQTILLCEQRTKAETRKLKTSGSVRLVPMTSAVWVALSEWRERATAETVFAGRGGRPMNAMNQLRRELRPATIKAGCPWAGWHHFRHTARTRNDASLTLAESMALLGHATVSQSMRYTHADLEKMRAGMERVQ